LAEEIMMRACLVGIGLLILLTPLAWGGLAAGSMAGTVVDPDGIGIPGILITVSGEGSEPVQVVSGYGGAFSVAALPPGTYAVLAALEGFEPARVGPVTVREQEAATVRVAFAKPVLHEMVEVTASREALATTEIRESGAADVGQALGAMPGVAMIRKGAIANDVAVRGLQRDNINVLIDGAKIYGACPNRMDSPAFHVDFSEVDHVEVTKGPFDVSNEGSLGGVVNVVTHQPDEGLHATATMVAGSAGFVNPSLTGSWAGDTVGGAAGYSYRTADPYFDGAGRRFTEVANYSASQMDSTAYRVGTAWGRFYYAPSSSDTMELAYTRQEASHVLYAALQMDADWDNADRLGFNWQHQSDGGLFQKVRVRMFATRVDHFMTDALRTTGVGTPRGWSMGTMADTSTLGGKAEAELGGFTVGLEGLRRGWDASTQMAKMGYMSQASIPDVVTSSYGLYASRSFRLASPLSLELGARLDEVRSSADPALANTNLYFAYNSTRETSASDTLPSATARLRWAAASNLEVDMSLGRTTRVPDPTERYFALKRAGSDWVGNPLLRPTTNTGAELAGTLHLQGGAVTGSVFYSALGDWISLHDQPRVNMQPGVMNTVARSYSNVDARMWGAELEATHAFTDHLFAAGSVTWTRGEKDTDPAHNINSPNLAEVPPLQGRASLRYDTGKVYGEAEGVFTAAQDRVDEDLQEQATPGWSVLNLKAGGTVAGLRVQAILANVFNRLYTEHLAFVRDPFKSGVRVWEPGRTFTLTATWRY
jgi:iron complex outermembrane recepter protein